ncbi:hypothetical protein AHF37_05213 [Paragonimus kellicotti]|nr:hypothetical protein AHF37_05213 [Paragonimus kellicotti]
MKTRSYSSLFLTVIGDVDLSVFSASDLATRNVLVTTRDHLQITDFGLAKMLEPEDEENKGEVIVRSGRVPIRWLAIETLAHGRYSFKTDVWAYGELL